MIARFVSPISWQYIAWARRREAREFCFGCWIFGDYRETQVPSYLLVTRESNEFVVRDIYGSVQLFTIMRPRLLSLTIWDPSAPVKLKAQNANRRKLFKQASVADKFQAKLNIVLGWRVTKSRTSAAKLILFFQKKKKTWKSFRVYLPLE